MEVPILYGRAIDEHDRQNGLRAAVVNQEFARRFFHGENPLGNTFTGSEGVAYQIVGVCADWRADRFLWRVDRVLDPVSPAFFTAFVQGTYPASIDFQVRVVAGDEVRALKEIRDAVSSVDPNLVIEDVHTEAEQIENVLAPQRLMASLAEIFGAMALALASIGIYGVMAYGTARRTNEIGIRMALGAQSRGIAWLVLRETLVLAVAGVAIGLPAVLGMNPVLDHFIGPYWRNGFVYGLKPNDPFVIIVVAALILSSAAVLAGYLPARRAARIEPMEALRCE